LKEISCLIEIKDFSTIFHLFLSVFFDFHCFSNYDTKKIIAIGFLVA